MTKLFESAWTSDFEYYVRYFDTNTNTSKIEQIDSKYEYYEEDYNGAYKYILDKSVRLSKRLGRYKDTHDKYGVLNPIYRCIRDNYLGKYNTNPDIMYLDIETRSRVFPDPKDASQEVILIQIFDTRVNTMFVFGLRDWKSEPDYVFDYDVRYIKCSDEIELLTNFGKIFRKLNPLIVFAWNGSGFDYPYLYNRAKRLGLDPSEILSVTCSGVKLRELENTTQEKYSLDSPGHFFCDMLDAYRKFIMAPRDSYSLDNIARVELKDNKVSHTEFTTFDGFYTGKDYQISETPYEDRIREEIRLLQIRKTNGENVETELLDRVNFQFVYYGIYDVFLLKKLDEKLHLSSIMTNISQTMGVLFLDTLGTLKPWERYIANTAFKEKLILPKHQEHEHPNIVGGYVRVPEVGKHHWVMSFDVNSMYPLLSMFSFNMSPETFIPKAKLPEDLRDLILRYFNDQNEEDRLTLDQSVWNRLTELLQKHNISMAVTGACFRRDHLGIIPTLVKEIYDRRKQEKKMMLKFGNLKVKATEIIEKNEFGEKIEFNISELVENTDSLNQYTKSALESIVSHSKTQEITYNVLQSTDKILINSLYGAQGNKHFSLFNEDIARAITGNGRYFIRKTANNIESHLQSLVESYKPYVISGDTDSVVGDSVIETSIGKIRIEDLYDNTIGTIEVTPNGTYLKKPNTKLTALSMNSNRELQMKDIVYIMKHKVHKCMYRIETEGTSVEVTENHSIIILRDNKLVSIEPNQIQSQDQIYINGIGFTSNFKVINLGLQELDVYDIEVQDNHNFFANDILVHNSVYFQIDPFVQRFKEKNPDAGITECTDFCLEFDKKAVQPIIQKTINQFADELNAFSKDTIGMKLENIMDTMIIIAKKKYLARVRDSEGTRFPLDHPKIKIMGLELIKSSTAVFTRDRLNDAIKILLDGNQSEMIEYLKQCEEEFNKVPLSDIAVTTSVSRVDYSLLKDNVPIGSRAAILYNNFVMSNGLDKKYNLISPGDKIKRLYLKEPNKFMYYKNTKINSDTIGFIQDSFAENELREYVDYDKCFEKFFLSPLKIMTDALGYDLKQKTTIDEW